MLKLPSSQLQTFKHSLLCFDEKIYLRKTPSEAVYCLALAKGSKIKIRVIFEGEEDCLAGYSVDMDNPALSCDFNEEKYEFTVKITHCFEPLKLTLRTPTGKESFILPVGHLKLLEPLADSAVETEKLTFKLSKTVKLENKSIPSYEHLVSKLCLLEKLVEKARSSKITRMFEGQRLKKKLERRYRLF